MFSVALAGISLLGEANLCARVLVTNRVVVWWLQGYDRLFRAFFTNVEISTNRPTSTTQKTRNQPLIIVGPLPTTQGNYKYAMVTTEYFIKWIEVKPLVNIASTSLKKFFWQNIIYWFRVPREITVDNAK
jgi:hypothetical protein